MAQAIQDDVVLGLTNKEANALTVLLESQQDLDPALVDVNNTLQTL